MTREDADLNLRPWLYRIAHNTSLNLLRQNGWTHEQLDENFDGVERPDQAFERREDLRSALDAVKALPERQRDALVLRELEGRRYDEIASELGVGDGAVRQLLHRARTTLRAGASAITPVGLLDRRWRSRSPPTPPGGLPRWRPAWAGAWASRRSGWPCSPPAPLPAERPPRRSPTIPTTPDEHGRDQALGLRQVRQRDPADTDGGRPARLRRAGQRRLERARLGRGSGRTTAARAATTPAQRIGQERTGPDSDDTSGGSSGGSSGGDDRSGSSGSGSGSSGSSGCSDSSGPAAARARAAGQARAAAARHEQRLRHQRRLRVGHAAMARVRSGAGPAPAPAPARTPPSSPTTAARAAATDSGRDRDHALDRHPRSLGERGIDPHRAALRSRSASRSFGSVIIFM